MKQLFPDSSDKGSVPRFVSSLGNPGLTCACSETEIHD